MSKGTKTKRGLNRKGFSLIELMIVVAIIGILSATAIAGYLGFQEKSRRAALERSAGAAEGELQGWLISSLTIGASAAFVEVDTNYDGAVGAGDLDNITLKNYGVAKKYAEARANEPSPWDNSIPLWVAGPAGNGQIGLSQSGNFIAITAKDMDGNPIFSRKVVSEQ